MDKSMLYGSADYAKDQYGGSVVTEDVFHRTEHTTLSSVQPARKPLQGEGPMEDVRDRLTADELALIRRLDGMSTARKNLSKVLSQTRRYDETAAPLYGILQKQYDRDLARDLGRAYVEATADATNREPVVIGKDELHIGAGDDVWHGQSATEWYITVRQRFETEGKEKKDT
jgi:hypothetical protein